MGIVGILIGAVLLVVPLWRTLPRAGIAAPWALAFRRWPADGVPERID